MIRRIFGAPLGGTTVGGHQGVDCGAVSLIVPPNFGGGGGNCFPSIVVVALGEPNTPVTCCAAAGAMVSEEATSNVAKLARMPVSVGFRSMLSAPKKMRKTT